MSDNYRKFHDGLSRRERRSVERVTHDAVAYFRYEPATDSEALAELGLANREVYQAHAETREKVFSHRRWREAPVDTLRLRLWQRLVLYIYFRYTMVN